MKQDNKPETLDASIFSSESDDGFADRERLDIETAPDFRIIFGLEDGEAFPLDRLSPMTRTRSLTETPSSSGGTAL